MSKLDPQVEARFEAYMREHAGYYKDFEDEPDSLLLNSDGTTGGVQEAKDFLAAELARKDEEKAEAVKQERKRILAWLNKNQSLETKELGKVVLWGWIYEVVKNNPTPEKEE